ncbi:MAG: twin-arginine translocase subunit TatC [Candidatus Omnitrophota bacterium]|nr:twin-arginine translocase subunit TatC [Candidatus Omnitrophota bacterium]
MERELTIIGHLNELRKRIIISLVALGIGTVFSLPFASYGLKILKLPSSGVIEKLVFFSPQEGFMIYMRIAFLSGLIVSMPVILYQVWAFILPAIEERLKRRSGIFILLCSGFFIIGCLFAYFILIPPALKFLLSFAKDDLEPVISAQKYISFVISLILGCGLVFQMPVLSFMLTKLGILDARSLRKKYKYAIVIIFIVAAVITPTPDAFNMFMLALPMLFLYELSIWISFFARPKLK